ncbi:MAG: AraC family transcriptional regulator [Romboutsia timonensis]|uniref:AraC family transcriptional regulator n=1 Tax=Romboutsia timonensis TaxID=1776391 RepID=UPI002A74FFD0|nr:AraC family transcriptional regulator [Romboutsia timonensis]MDY2881745.1 AraC family transcriptional regulator [Romboutsia timonensis]
MFIKTSNPAFKDFGDIVYDDMDFSSSHKINLNNKFIDNLKLVTNDYTFIKVTKGVVMILVSFDSNNIKSFIINRSLHIKKGIYFNFISISDEASVEVLTNTEFKSITLDNPFNYSNISSSLDISEIYTKFYQEKGTNYNFSGEKHSYWELTYVDKGELLTTIDRVSYHLKQGDLIFYAPMQFHTQSTFEKISSSYLTINFKMNFNHADLLCNKIFSLQRDSYFIVTRLIEELSNDNLYSDDLSLCYLKELIIQMLRLDNSHFHSKPTTHMQQTYENELLNDILLYIDDNIYEKISVSTLCDHFCISTSMLHSLFRKNMNNTAKNYINELKLSKSKELIRNSTHTLSEISEMLGFSSIHYFSKKFKSYFNISPTEYSKSIYN